MDNSRIFAVTQAALAIIIVAGGGAMLFFVPERSEAVVGIVGLVVGFFFRSMETAQARADLRDVAAQAAQERYDK